VVVDVEDSRFALARKLEAADLKFSDRPLAHAGAVIPFPGLAKADLSNAGSFVDASYMVCAIARYRIISNCFVYSELNLREQLYSITSPN
jgi:hypothetical protein